jgi:hypothetical protein
MADAPELDDPVRLAVILDVPAGRADGWRFSGRGPRWARMRAPPPPDRRVSAWLLEERDVQAGRTDRRVRQIDWGAALERLEARG